MPYKRVEVTNFTVDFIADLEVTGTPITNRRFSATLMGDNVLLAIAPGTRLKLYKALLTVDADTTGEVILKIGAVEVAGILNPRLGGEYILVSAFPDYEFGTDGDDLIINLPGAGAITLNASYEVV